MLHTRPVRCSGAAKLRHSAKSAAVRTHASKQPAASPAPEGPSGDAPRFQLPMGRRGVLSGLGFGAAGTVVGCSCPGCVPQARADEWGYGDVSGPTDWGGMCAQGTTQSPVNIPLRNLGRASAGFSIGNYIGDFQFNYGKFEPTTILNTGHGTMQVNFQPGNSARVGDKELELLQFHFHTPSEHAIDSSRTPMEVHLVHRNQNTGGLAVVGILIERGAKAPNPTVRDAVKYAPLAKRKLAPCPVLIDPAQLLPPTNQQGLRPFVHYQGSLTTPPCSEMVEWFVLTDPIYVSDKQILDFMEYAGGGKDYGRNARPVQSLNSRRFDYQSIPIQLNL